MIIERHKASPTLAKALDKAKLSHFSTLEIPYEDFQVEFQKAKKAAPAASAEDLNAQVIVKIAQRLYGGERSAAMF